MSLNVSYEISAIDNFSRTMGSLDGKFKGLSQTAGRVGGAVASIGAVGATASAAVLGVGLNYLAGMEKAEVGLETLTGSAKETQQIIGDLQKFATTTPFDFTNLLAGERRLIGMGMSSEEATGMLKATADAVAAAGGGTEELDGVVTALGQIKSKGKISAEEMNQLAERGIPAWKILSESMGLSTSELMDMASEGKLLADDALPALQKGFETAFGGAAVEQANTFSGRLSNLKEQFDILAGALAKPIFEPMKEAMGKLVEKSQHFSAWFEKLPSGVQTFITVALILTPILTLIAGGFIMLIGFLPMVMAGFTTLTAVVFPFIASILPIVAIVAGIILAMVGIGIALFQAYQKLDWFRAMVDTAWAAIKSAWNTALTFIIGIVKTIMTEVSTFLGAQLDKIRAFWDRNGAQIMNLVKTYFTQIQSTIKMVMGIIEGIFQVVWPIISGIVKIAWELIKTVIGTAIDIVLGLIETAMNLLEGDWEGAWNSIKGIAEDIWNNIEGFFENIDLVQIGKDIIQGLIDGIGSMGGAIKTKIESMASLIPAWAKDILGVKSPSRVMMEIGSFTSEGMAIGIMDGMKGIANASKSMASAALPKMSTPDYSAQRVSSSAQQRPSVTNNTPVNITLNYSGSASRDEAQEMLRFVSEGLAKELRYEARLSGVKLG